MHYTTLGWHCMPDITVCSCAKLLTHWITLCVCGDGDCIYISNTWDTISNFVVTLWIYFRFEIGCCQRNKICIWRCYSQASYSVSVCVAIDLTFLLSFWFSSFECFFESSNIDDNLKQQLVVLLPASSTTSAITKIVHIEGVCWVCMCMWCV